MAEYRADSPPPAPSVYSSVSDISGQYPDIFCYRCSSEFDRQRAAIWHCVECSESFCKKCYPEHFRNKKENWSHTIKDMAGMNPFKQKDLKKQAPVEFLDTSCTHCARDEKAVRAIRYCKDCKANLCTTCLKWHNDSERYIGHTMKRVWEEQMESLTQEKCQKHPEEIISRYCKDHDAVCCIKCSHLDHRNCKLSEEIQKIEVDIKRNQTDLSIKKTINKAKMNTLRLIQARKDDMNRIEDERYNILVGIQTNRERINEHLDRLEKKSKEELKVRYEKFMEEINQDIQQLEEMLSKLDIEASKLQTFEEDNESQQFIYLKQAEQTTRQSNTLEQKVDLSSGSEYLNFNMNIKVIDTICDLKSLGDFSVFSLSMADSFKVRTKKDKYRYPYYVLNICLMSDGSLMCANGDTSKITKFDASNKVTAECKLAYQPTAICSTGPTEVAITMHRGIQFASVTNKVSLTRSFKVDGFNCQGIAYNDEELFVALQELSLSSSKGKVVVYNPLGQILRSLMSDITRYHSLVTNIATNIAISSGGKMVHITGRSIGLVTMDKTGHKLWEKTELKGISGLTTTENDSLIVCNASNDDITFWMIDKDGKTKKELLHKKKSQLSCPECILYDTANSKLFVTNRSTIHVYNLTSM